MTPRHWLVRLAADEGLPGVEALAPPAGAPLEEVWAAVASACGIDPWELAALVAARFRSGVADFDRAESSATKLLPESIVTAHVVFPLRSDNRHLVVATADPTDVEAEREIGFASGRTPVFEIAPPGPILEAARRAYSPEKAAASLLAGVDGAVDAVVEVVEAEEPEAVSEEDTASGPVVRLANMIIHEAVARGASDIHIQPLPTGGVVRFRVDGVLRTGMQMPLPVLTRVISRIKIMGRLDITDRLRPQDGRARVAVEGRTYDLRISTVPTRHAEKCVIRILDPAQSGTLDDTGILDEDVARIRRVLRSRDGIFVVTGPTGSGKTTTLYAALRELSTEDVNVMTVEDPVEYELPGLTQIQVEAKQGMTFASALRAILRQDPDVIFVGEIRDGETAAIAAQASLTGHLVLATLHTNDAVGALRRFMDLGLDPSTVTETLRGVLAQRLVRRVCPSCTEPVDGELSAEEEEAARRYGVRPTVRGVGCERCSGSGYVGRLPVTEFLTVTPDLVRLVLSGAPPMDLQDQGRRDGMKTLLESALERVARGETTLAEVERVIGEEQPGADTPPPPARPPSDLLPEAPPPAAPVGAGATGFDSTPDAPAPLPGPDGDAADSGAVRGATAPPSGTGGSASASDPLEGSPLVPRILVVDDDGANRTIARALLEREGYEVEEAADGSEALARLARGEHFSLMVLDLDMPMLGGREVLKAVRGSVTTAGLPVVVLTGSGDPAAEIELLDAGADDYIRKPIDPPRFLTRIRATLRRAAA